MEEAVEICKLRLFLKLVAQVDDKNRLEPLPDIDFNIRAGNTLVGFTSLDAVREAMSVDARGNRRLLFLEEEAEIVDIEESAGLVEQAYSRFREQQTTFGGAVTTADKSDLRDRLAQLDSRLDRYLARQYGVDPANAAAFTAWKASHQPFHWFVEFHGVIARGGFDVVIGNPPYVELREVRGYAAQGFECITCGNLYALVIERCFTLGAKHGRQGYIVPVSSVSTDRYAALQQLLSSKVLHYSSYDDRPSRLFDGLEHIRLTIHLIGASSGQPKAFSTKYNKWNAVERQTLFDTLSYQTVIGSRVEGSLPKLTSPYEESVLSKLADPPLATSFAKSGSCTVFYSRKVGYFLQVLNFVPSVLDGNGNRRLPSEFKELRFSEASTGDAALCALNSSLFFWFIHVFSDCRHVNKREIEAFPLSPKLLASSQLSRLGDALMIDLDATSVHQTMRFGHDTLTVQQILPKHSKPIIDEIDRALARHYSFTAEELDFIINYDIKYRMGASDGPGE